MTISAKTLFHFTKTADSLVSILDNGFYPRYCLERFPDNFISENPEFDELAIPMVCFCDIPLAQIGEHIKFYGEYGIGLDKQWGIKKGLNPVVYIQNSSLLAKHIKSIREGYHQMERATNTGGVHWFEMASYFKPVKGQMYKSGSDVEKEFYNEREWRFVPLLHNEGGEEKYSNYRLYKSEYLDDSKKNDANQELEKSDALEFSPTDVKYLIVPSDEEAISLVNSLEKMKQRGYSNEDFSLLISRILTCDQITYDF